jgi:hypothetical protein
VSDSFPLGPCFTTQHVVALDCAHPESAKFRWFARDDTVKSGQVDCIACMACGAVLFVGETQTTRALAKIRKAHTDKVTR